MAMYGRRGEEKEAEVRGVEVKGGQGGSAGVMRERGL